MAQVKLVRVYVASENDNDHNKEYQKRSEEKLTNLVNQGWRIVAGGGNASAGLVVLQKD